MEGEIKRILGASSDFILDKLDRLRKGLMEWEKLFKANREGQKQGLTKKLKGLMDMERDDDTLTELIDTKVHLNLEIDKEEAFWNKGHVLID